MQDINNITQIICAKAPVQPPSLVAALQAFITNGNVPNVPQALTQAPAGQLITAVVLATNPKGQIFVQTPQGQVTFSSDVPLKVGQQITYETLPREAPPQRVAGAPPPPPNTLPIDVRLVRVNGVQAEKVFPEATQTATSTPETNAQSSIQSAQQKGGGIFLQAVFPQRPAQQKTAENNTPQTSLFEAEAVEFEPSALQTQATFRAAVLATPKQSTGFSPQILAPIADIPEALAAIKEGDVLIIKIVGGTLAPADNSAPRTTLSPSIAQPTPTTEATAQIAEIAASPVEDAPPTPLLQRAFPNAPAQTASNTPAISTLPALVIAQESSGSAIIQTPIATLRLPPEIPLPKGTQLSLKITHIEPALDAFAANQLPLSFQTGTPATDALLKGNTSLDVLFKQLFGFNPEAAKEVGHELVPQVGRQFGNKILAFIKNVQDESLPETIRQTLPKEMVEQLGLNKVSQEFSSLKTAMMEAQPPQWSFMLVPVMRGEEMHNMRWLKRKQEAEDGSNREGTRFVVELETESLGNLQLDGLFFSQPREKQFDLVIRSTNPFTSEEKENITGIYNSYGEISGYKGSLKFEEASTFPIHPIQDILEGEQGEISA